MLFIFFSFHLFSSSSGTSNSFSLQINAAFLREILFSFSSRTNLTSIALHYSMDTGVFVFVGEWVSEWVSEIHYGKHFIIKNNSRFSRAHVFFVVSNFSITFPILVSLSTIALVHFVTFFFPSYKYIFIFSAVFPTNNIAFVLVAWLSNFVFLFALFLFPDFLLTFVAPAFTFVGANFYFHTCICICSTICCCCGSSSFFLLAFGLFCVSVGRSVAVVDNFNDRGNKIHFIFF